MSSNSLFSDFCCWYITRFDATILQSAAKAPQSCQSDAAPLKRLSLSFFLSHPHPHPSPPRTARSTARERPFGHDDSARPSGRTACTPRRPHLSHHLTNAAPRAIAGACEGDFDFCVPRYATLFTAASRGGGAVKRDACL